MKKKQFLYLTKNLSRGDIVLNCDGMRYSEKVFKAHKTILVEIYEF